MSNVNTVDFENQRKLFGHPVGLYILFFTEMWERFSYYGMRAILVLFLVSTTAGDNPGFGWTNAEALALYGWYTMFVYVASIPGGILADRYIGQKKAVLVGGILLVAGHSVLAIESEWAFYVGLTLIVLGVGCLKPNISTMVGGLYQKGAAKRDMGFYIFYIGINLGAAIGSLLVGYLGERVGWSWGFGAAGIGMALGLVVYLVGQPYLNGVGNLVKLEPEQEKTNLFTDIFKKSNSLFPTIVIALAGLFVLWQYSWQWGLFVMGLSLAVGVAIAIYNQCNPVEKDRILVTYLSFLIIIVFWGAFEQAGGLMNLYAAEKTNLALGSFNVPASWFQSVNAIYIIIFATVVGMFWNWWRKQGRESAAIFKMAIGVIIMGLGFLFMSAASKEADANGLSSMHWLLLAYLLHTLGELCASPVALSFITKLSPARFVAFMMGAYFAATGIGNKVAGSLGELSTTVGEFKVFTGIAIFCAIFGILVILILKPLKRLTHGAEEVKVDAA